MKLYIAGPMTGLPDFNRPAFCKAAEELRAQGYEVANPAELEGDDRDPWDLWVRKALALMLTCDAVVFLPGWRLSRGARLEHLVADELGMRQYAYARGTLIPLN